MTPTESPRIINNINNNDKKDIKNEIIDDKKNNYEKYDNIENN